MLLHDESAYQTLFGEEFQTTEKLKLQDHSKAEIKDELFPICYYAERLPVFSSSPEEFYDTIFELFEILSETEQMDYFLCGFIQRLIDYMWDSQLVRWYNAVSFLYLTSFSLIVGSTILLRWQDTAPRMAGGFRAGLMSLNLIVLLGSLCTFEIKSLLNDGFDYFKSFYNQNDMLLFALSAACLA